MAIKNVSEKKIKKKCIVKILNKSITKKNYNKFNINISKYIKLKKKKTFKKNIEIFMKKIIKIENLNY